MEAILIWFIMANGTGYIEPQRVEAATMHCGEPGAIVGVQLDRLVNPRVVLWPDPTFADRHCEIDISQRVAGLAHGEYHLATTILGKSYKFGETPERYIGHDPHTSDDWLRSLTSPGLPKNPLNFRVGDKP